MSHKIYVMVERDMAKDINLRELFMILKKRFWMIIFITLVATGAGYFQNNTQLDLLYQSSSRIIVGANAEYMKTLMVIMRDPVIMEKVGQKLELNRSPERLAGQISIDSIDNSQVLRITVIDTDPVIAADIANATVSVFKAEIGNIVDFNDVSYLSDAKVNQNPINSKDNRIIYITFIIGLMIGIGFVFLLHSLDDTVNSLREIEELVGVPVLGTVSKMTKKNINKKKQKQFELEYRGEI
ncbi:Wzz/FepE/Etk N-terminal domain-containing protein [Bacillaceae bacterium IKA-2]|nr:Wzz/FepE/Etk N-terminal domain-containing protein [Bacillaceae bacterium IKA-2]